MLGLLSSLLLPHLLFAFYANLSSLRLVYIVVIHPYFIEKKDPCNFLLFPLIILTAATWSFHFTNYWDSSELYSFDLYFFPLIRSLCHIQFRPHFHDFNHWLVSMSSPSVYRPSTVPLCPPPGHSEPEWQMIGSHLLPEKQLNFIDRCQDIPLFSNIP